MLHSSSPDRLELGMYDYLGRSEGKPSRRFGLREGQIEDAGRVIKDAGWYSAVGVKLGYGDLNSAQIARIAKELQPDEMFVALNEEDSFWKHVKTPGIIGSLSVSAIEKQIDDEEDGGSPLIGEKDEFSEKLPGTKNIASVGEIAVVSSAVVFCGNNRATSYQQGLEDIPMILKHTSDWNTSVARHHGKEVAAEHKVNYWPGDDIQEYAEQLPLEVLDRPDFFLRVTQFAAGDSQ